MRTRSFPLASLLRQWAFFSVGPAAHGTELRLSGGNAPLNEGGPAWLGSGGFFTRPNPAFWQAVDRRVATVTQAGFVASLAVGIGRR